MYVRDKMPEVPAACKYQNSACADYFRRQEAAYGLIVVFYMNTDIVCISPWD